MELLLEIGVEEIPAGYLEEASLELYKKLRSVIFTNNLLPRDFLEKGPRFFDATPRRIMSVINDILEKQPNIVEERTGPSVKAAFDADGNPTKAALGFAKGAGVDVSELEKIDTSKGEYLQAKIKKIGRPAEEVLAEILPKIITSLPWPKSMKWGDGDLRFARPIHWVLAILDGKVIDFEIEGIKSGNTTRGHRFAAPDAFEVKNHEDYKKKLHDAFVMVDYQERKEAVNNGIKKRAKKLGGEPACADALFDEISNLVEWPVIIDASFPDHYLELPDAVLIASMTGHQRYVPLRNNFADLMPRFITVANTPVKDIDIVAHGNERVLNARLADAEFFYKADLKKSIEEHAKELKDVVYIKGIGSYADKTNRIVELAEKVAGWIQPGDAETAQNARRAAKLCKADLVTLMVGEFPALQGQMGKIYAKESGENEAAAKAIEEHYLPRSAADIDKENIPESWEGCAVAIADRADSLVSCFALGLLPKGDQDHYALRRAVLGILAIIKQKQIRISITDLMDAAVDGVAEKLDVDKDKLMTELLDFFRERIRHQLLADQLTVNFEMRAVPYPSDPPEIIIIAPDTAEAVLRSGFDDYLDVWNKAEALTELRKRDDFDDLAVSFRRVGNILEDFHSDSVDESLFSEESERKLWEDFKKKRDSVAELAGKRKYLEALQVMAELRPLVDEFFDNVLVNDPKDTQRRENRHSILYAIHKSFLAVADFSAIAKPGS